MMMQNKDRECCKDVRPSFIRLYLEKRGWNEIQLTKKRFFDVFQTKKDNVLYQINIPNNDELVDYEDMIYSACLKLSDYEQIPLKDLISRMINPQADILKIRMNSDNVINGSISLNDVVGLVDASKRLLADSAMDILNKTKYRTSRFPKEVDYFID